MTTHALSAGRDLGAHSAAAALSEPITHAAATANPAHAFELERISTRHESTASLTEQGASELPPVDRGKGALTFLAAAFFLGEPRPGPARCWVATF